MKGGEVRVEEQEELYDRSIPVLPRRWEGQRRVVVCCLATVLYSTVRLAFSLFAHTLMTIG